MLVLFVAAAVAVMECCCYSVIEEVLKTGSFPLSFQVTNTGTLMSGVSVLNSLPPQTPIVGTMNGSLASTMPIGLMQPPVMATSAAGHGQAIPMQAFPQHPLPPTPGQQQQQMRTASTNSLLGKTFYFRC